MRFRRLKRQEAGQPIEAQTLAETADVAEWSSKLRAQPPLEIVSTATGPLIRLAGMLFGVYLIKTTTALTARSGTTPGTGNADLMTFDGSGIVPLNVNMAILNYSGASGGIASGLYGVALKICGKLWLISAECPT